MYWLTGDRGESLVGIDAALGIADETGLRVQDVFLHSTAALIAVGRGDRVALDDHLAAADESLASGSVHMWGVDLDGRP